MGARDGSAYVCVCGGRPRAAAAAQCLWRSRQRAVLGSPVSRARVVRRRRIAEVWVRRGRVLPPLQQQRVIAKAAVCHRRGWKFRRSDERSFEP